MSKQTETVIFCDGSSYEVPMTEQQIQDWEREIKHAAKMQEQRANGQRLDVIRATYDVPRNIYSIKDESNEK